MGNVRGNMAYEVKKGGARHIGNAVLPDSMIAFIDAPGILEAARRIFKEVREVSDDRVSLRFWHGAHNRIVFIYVDGKLIGFFKGRKG